MYDAKQAELVQTKKQTSDRSEKAKQKVKESSLENELVNPTISMPRPTVQCFIQPCLTMVILIVKLCEVSVTKRGKEKQTFYSQWKESKG